MKGRFLSSGRCAEVYEWNEEHVVKVYHREFAAAAESEFQNNRVIKDLGIPSPLAESMVEVEGLTSIVFERIRGVSMLEHIFVHPSALTEMASLLGQLHAQVHEHPCGTLPKQGNYLRRKIERADIDECVRAKALDALEQLPQEDKLCHGDFHLGNVMITKTSPQIIDWVDAAQGNPLADIVWTRLLLSLDNLPKDAPNREAINSVRPILDDGYCKGYRKVRHIDEDALRPWVFPVAVARLGDGLLSEREQLLNVIQKYDSNAG